MDHGIIVDLETTGLDPDVDQIIEIGILGFALEDGRDPVVTTMYGGLEDPGVEISAEITKITGIHPSDVVGQKINWSLVNQLIADSSIAIAHNAAFDRSFLKKRSEVDVGDIHWACSMRHINWAEHGFKTRNLNYLAADKGFVNPFAHRALFDCATTFRVITPHISELIERSYEREYKVLAVGAPFAAKDALKERKYRWDPEARVWGKTFCESELEAEREFLAEVVYGGQSRHEEIEVNDLQE